MVAGIQLGAICRYCGQPGVGDDKRCIFCPDREAAAVRTVCSVAEEPETLVLDDEAFAHHMGFRNKTRTSL